MLCLTFIAPLFLKCHQEFVTDTKEVAYHTNSDEQKLPIAALYSNADESDSRIWFHCIDSYSTQKLLYCPDTYIYHIGLTQTISDQHVVM